MIFEDGVYQGWAGGNGDISGLSVNNGGTGNTSFPPYGVVTGGTTSTGGLQGITPGSSGTILVSGGTGGPSVWTTLAGAGAVTSVTGTANQVASTGGSTPVISLTGPFGFTTLTSNGILYGAGTSAISATAAMTNGQILVGQTSSAPLPKTLSGDATLASSGAITIASLAITTGKIAANAVTSAKVDSSIIVAAGSNPFTADQSMGSHKLTNVTDPDAAQDAATKNYVDLATAALSAKLEAQAATTAALAAATYNNGSSGVGATITLTVAAVLVLDGYTPALNDRLLIKNQAAPAQNGVYYLSTVGVLGVTQAVLTRTLDFDQSSDGVNGALIYVLNGTTNGNTLWACTTSGSITFGTTAINWSQFTGGTYTADETTLHLTGTTFSIKSTYVGQATITTVGTLTSGATGTGFTVALTTSTVTGNLPAANLPAFSGGDVTSSAGSANLSIGAGKVTAAMLASSAMTWYGRMYLNEKA